VLSGSVSRSPWYSPGLYCVPFEAVGLKAVGKITGKPEVTVLEVVHRWLTLVCLHLQSGSNEPSKVTRRVRPGGLLGTSNDGQPDLKRC
jgi:hypothetical protein